MSAPTGEVPGPLCANRSPSSPRPYPREHREALEEIAARDDRTLSYLVRQAVERYLRANPKAEA